MSEFLPPALSLSARLEPLLFVAPGPVTNAQLANALEVPVRAVDEALTELELYYTQTGRALRLQRLHGRVQLTTAPEVGGLVERFLGLEASARLSQAALEVLAIVAYRRPITRPQVDAIRGVNSDGALKSLLSKGLVEEVGRSSSPGRPILYSVTAEFLQHFGLGSLAELPPLDSDPSSETNVQVETTSQEAQGKA
ncbi:MAG: SMC-Scp complex subunit ScpB [Anaerolineales bacterium]